MDCSKFSDEELKKYHLQVMKACTFCEFGNRIGVKTPKFLAISLTAKQMFQEIEKEYEKRHPERIEQRRDGFIKLAENLFDTKNADDYGKPQDATEYFTEYNTPQPGMKRKTQRTQIQDENGEFYNSTETTDLQMNPIDSIYAELENALDEYAEQQPDGPAARQN